jgi:hypothetical protein
MDAFYAKIKEAFRGYQCRMYDNNEICLTPKHYLNFSLGPERLSFKIESFVDELDDFLKANTCPHDHMRLQFKILIKDRFDEYNCYGFKITRSGIDDIEVDNIIIKDFNKNAIIDLAMVQVNKESFIHVVDIDTLFW